MAIIKLLKEYPDYAPILAFWSYSEWYKKRSVDFDIIVKSYQQKMNDTDMPISWVALEDKFPVGMVSLKQNDLWSRKNLNPWLTSLYVSEDFRNRGIGSMLIETIIDKSRALQFKKLHLFISGGFMSYLENYYTKRGWRYIEDAIGNDNDIVKIFEFSL